MRARNDLLCLAAALALTGCAAAAYPPAIPPGSACAACGMAIEDLHFATEQRTGGAWRVYDSIECLLREPGAAGEAFLSDYDTSTLHAADSMWVVRGRLASPMGGGLAAFRTRAQADEVAEATSGVVFLWDSLRADAAGTDP